MIQDIMPHKLNNTFKTKAAQPMDIVFTFHNGKVLVCREDDRIRFPVFEQFTDSLVLAGIDLRKIQAVYAFSVDEKPMFLLSHSDNGFNIPDNMEYIDMRGLAEEPERWMALAAVTASHLNHWYEEHKYCGCCGSKTVLSEKERATVCPECGNIQYPRISPVIMAAVTDGDRLLVTRYAGRPYKGLALIAGFVEIGESLEQALEREVMEEVGLKVKNIKYFGSQPWGFSDSVISGFFVELDGSDQVKLDRDELAEGIWISRKDIPPQDTSVSITSAMIEAFRQGDV